MYATYGYTDDRNNYLSSIDYGNKDSVNYTYDDKGRLTTQTYEDGDTEKTENRPLSCTSPAPAITQTTPPTEPTETTEPTPYEPSQEELMFAATVYAEAGGENETSQQAVAHVINNRVGTRSSWTSIEAVISAPYQFDGYGSSMYKAAMDYYNTGVCDNIIDKAAMDQCLAVVIPIYNGIASDITRGALYFHSFSDPTEWPYHDALEEVPVSGAENFHFYK